MCKPKTALVSYLVSALIMAVMAATTSASVFYYKDRYSVAENDTINDDIYMASGEGIFRGVVTGDIFVACKDYSVTGDILGSVNSASETATIRGTVGNSARIFAKTIIIYGEINNNLLAFGQDIDIGDGSRIGKDATIFGQEVSLSGEINNDLIIECQQVVISGKIDGNVTIEADKISIVAPAEITGDITYKSKREIRIDDDVVVDGQIEWDKIEEKDSDSGSSGINWAFRIVLFMASLVTGLFILGFTNRHARIATSQVIDRPLVSLGVGFVAFCVTPVAILVLLALIIGIPVALILLFAYTIFFYIAKIYVAVAVGQVSIRAFRKDAQPKMGISLLIGLIILSILFAIPVLGWIVYFAVIFWGIGAILLGLRACRMSASANNGVSAPTPPPVT